MAKMNPKWELTEIPVAVLRRLPRYYRCMRELLGADILRISSNELADRMNLTAAQIRRDFSAFGSLGQRGYGYNVKDLYSRIGGALGVNRTYRAVLIGVSGFGGAMAVHPVFDRRGVTLCALFDYDKKLVGSEINGIPIQGVEQLEEYYRNTPFDIAVVAAERLHLDELGRRLSDLQVAGIWNISGSELPHVSGGVCVRAMNVFDSLLALCCEIEHGKQDIE